MFETWQMLLGTVGTGIAVVAAVMSTTRGLRREIHDFRDEITAFGREVTRLATVIENMEHVGDGLRERLNQVEVRLGALERFQAAEEARR